MPCRSIETGSTVIGTTNYVHDEVGNLISIRVLIALSAMVFVQPVTADDCNVDYHKNAVPVDEGETGIFRFKVQCDTTLWIFKTFRYKYTTQEDSAKNSVDYKEKAGVHVFHPAGGPNYTQVTSVNTLADDECEGDEIFRIKYSLEGNTKAGWTDWSAGARGLPGSFTVVAKIQDKC